MGLPNLLASRWGRLLAFFCLYVTEGIPLGFTSTAIATQLRRSGVGPMEIGFFVGWLYFPWAWKWVMGPIVDLFYSNRLGARRGWIIGTQVMMVLTLLCCAPFELKSENLQLLTAIILVHNFFCATQDVAIDALACNTLKPEERGLANGLMFAGQTLGIPLGGACVLYLIDGISWLPMLQDGLPFSQTYFFVIGCILAVTVFVAIPMREEAMTRPELDEGHLTEIRGELNGYVSTGAQLSSAGLALLVKPVSRASAALLRLLLPSRAEGRGAILRVELVDYMLTAAKSFFGSRAAFAALIVALMPAGAMALNLALQKTLAVELGMSDSEVADLEVISSIVWAVSCVTGGLISDRVGHLKSLAVFFVLMSIPGLWLGFQMERAGYIMPVETVSTDDGAEMDSQPDPKSVIDDAEEGEADQRPESSNVLVNKFWWAVMFYMAAQGLMYGTRTAVFMEISNPAVAATQFTAYMAMMNLVIAYSSWWQGICIEKWGYPITLFIDAGTGALCVFILPFLNQKNRVGEVEAVPVPRD